MKVDRRPNVPPEPAVRTKHDDGKPRALVAVVVTTNALGNFALSRGMRDVGETVSLSPLPYIAALLNPWVLVGVFLLITWLICQLSLLSRADLSFVLPLTSMAYIIGAVLGWMFLGEYISGPRWTGVLLITAGAVLVGRTKPLTAPQEERHR